MLGAALALVGGAPGKMCCSPGPVTIRVQGVEDEDQQMDGERLAEDAKDTGLVELVVAELADSSSWSFATGPFS